MVLDVGTESREKLKEIQKHKHRLIEDLIQTNAPEGAVVTM